MNAVGTWQTQLIGAFLLVGSSVATAFATKYWHVIISYAIVESKYNVKELYSPSLKGLDSRIKGTRVVTFFRSKGLFLRSLQLRL